MNIAILGASQKTERYSNKAQVMLMADGHKVYPISSIGEEILGVKGYSGLSEINERIDIATIYINPKILNTVIDDLIKLNPKTVIFNPGTESAVHQEMLTSKGIKVVEACTLVLLCSGQFEGL